jgi:hypothetical protein
MSVKWHLFCVACSFHRVFLCVSTVCNGTCYSKYSHVILNCPLLIRHQLCQNMWQHFLYLAEYHTKTHNTPVWHTHWLLLMHTDLMISLKKPAILLDCTRWFKYDRDYLCVNKSQFVPVIFEPPCIICDPEGSDWQLLTYQIMTHFLEIKTTHMKWKDEYFNYSHDSKYYGYNKYRQYKKCYDTRLSGE